MYKNIEFFRFVFAIAVILFHIVHLNQFDAYGLGELKSYFINANIAVIYFFYVGFYFLITKQDKYSNILLYAIIRFGRLAPGILGATLIAYFFRWTGLIDINVNYWVDLENVLLIRDVFALDRWGAIIHPAWFCSQFFFVSIFYLLLKKALTNNQLNLILFVLLILSWRWYTMPDLKYNLELIHYDMAKSLFSLCVAYFSYNLFNGLKNISWESLSLKARGGVVILEMLMMVVIFVGVFYAKVYIPEIISIIIFVAVFYFLISKIGLISRILNNNLSVFLGRYAFAIYLVHIIVLDMLRTTFLPRFCESLNLSVIQIILIAVTLSCILGVVFYHVIEKPTVSMTKKIVNIYSDSFLRKNLGL